MGAEGRCRSPRPQLDWVVYRRKRDSIVGSIRDKAAEMRRSSHHPDLVMSDRQLAILAFLMGGKHPKAIARTLGLSVHTINWHVARLRRKLGAGSNAEFVAIALRHGFIELPGSDDRS